MKKKKMSIDLCNEPSKPDSADLQESTESYRRRSPNLIKLEENVRNQENLDLSLVNEFSDDNMLDKKHKFKDNPDSPPRSPKGKKEKRRQKNKRSKAIDDFCEVDFKKSFHELNHKHSGEGKTYDEK